jgi:4-amino-4-deoxy-L-arabinose transferase-like glycosyltransferase
MLWRMAMSARAETRAREAGVPGSRAGRRPSALQVIVALTAAGAALRFATLDVQSIWGDESITIALVHRSFSSMISHLSSSESTPPLYYSLAWLWTKLFGTGPVGFRTLSALAGTLTIPVVWACGREISDRVAGWAAALTVVSPAMYYYSQEARAYALLILFCALAFLFFERAAVRRDGRSLAWWGGFSVLALLTHYFAAFLFLPEAAILAWRLGWRRVLAPVAVVAVTGLALLPLAIDQRNSGKAKWIEESSLVSRIGETAKQFLVGLYSPLQIVTAVISGALVLGILWLLVTRARGAERDRGRDAAIVAAVGVALPLVLAAGHLIDVFDGRNVIAAWVPYAVLVAIGIGCAASGRLGAALGAAACAIGIVVIVATNLLPGYQRDDWRGVAEALPKRTPYARVLVVERYGGSPLSVYLGSLHAPSTSRVKVREIAFAHLRTRHTSGAPYAPYLQLQAPHGFRLASVEKNEAFAVTRFVASGEPRVPVSGLIRLSGSPSSEVLFVR